MLLARIKSKFSKVYFRDTINIGGGIIKRISLGSSWVLRTLLNWKNRTISITIPLVKPYILNIVSLFQKVISNSYSDVSELKLKISTYLPSIQISLPYKFQPKPN